MSSVKKVNTSRKKATLQPSKTGYLGSKNLNFHHQATLNDVTIDLTDLNGYIPGINNPSPVDFSNVQAFVANFVLKSETREYELVRNIDYNLSGVIITFLNGFEALEDEKFFGSVLLPTSNAIVSESKTEVSQFELPIGDVLLNIGTTYEVNLNSTQQIGAIKVFRDGMIQLRCEGNLITNEGNYIEIDSGNGFGNSIQFKVANGVSIDGIVVCFGVHQVSDVNVFSDLERLAGSILQLSNDMADVTGNPVEDYLTASVSETDRLTLANQVLDHETRIDVLESLPLVAYVKDVKPSGTDGGDFNSGSFITRILNDLSGDTSFISLNGSNQFILQPGKYTFEGAAPALGVNRHRCKLANITDAPNSIFGMSMFTSPASGVFNVSEFTGSLTISVPTTFEVQHRGETTKNTDGFGVDTSFGDDEVYTQVKITKIG